MLKNYLTIAYRNLRRRPGYTAINIGGLAVGLAACLLIGLYVRYELSYDEFHEKADRIYRVATIGEGSKWSGRTLYMSALLAPTLEREFPGIAEAVRVSIRWGLHSVKVARGEAVFYEDRFLLADSNFFDVFSFPLKRGNPETALKEPFSIVLTEEAVQKYFGEENPMGKTIQVEAYGKMYDLTVTGVAKNPPSSTHLPFDMLASFTSLPSTMPEPEHLKSWGYLAHYTYVLLEKGYTPADFRQKLPAFADTHEGVNGPLRLQPITGIHLRSHFDQEWVPNSDMRYVYIFSVLALLVLGVACINYMNLATARSAHRAKEVGVRKVVGAHRWQLARQFMGESALLCGAALVLAVILARLSLPLFNQLTGTSVGFGALAPGTLLLGLLGIGVLVTLAAGSYPALFLSGFRPVPVLRGFFQSGSRSALLRKGLVVFQFAVSVALIAATFIVWSQLRHMQTKRLGLNTEHVVVVHARGATDGRGYYHTFKQELLQHTAITGVTGMYRPLPAPQGIEGALVPEGWEPKRWYEEKEVAINSLTVDPDFTEVMDIPVLEGRDLSADFRSEAYTPVLINETAARKLGWEEPIGKTFTCCFRPTPKVVGVVEDFHYQPLRTRIAPLVLMERWSSPDAYYGPSRVLVRIQPGDPQEALSFIRRQWQTLSDTPFSYTFLDRRFEEAYRAEERMASIFGTFAGLAVVIACLGLFGLAAYAAERRSKEIGIRKVLGASVPSIVRLLSKDFLKLVLAAFVIAAPVAYWAMQRWLQDFAYRIDLGPWIFVGAGALAGVIALATVSYQATRAALANPVEALRSE